MRVYVVVPPEKLKVVAGDLAERGYDYLPDHYRVSDSFMMDYCDCVVASGDKNTGEIQAVAAAHGKPFYVWPDLPPVSIFDPSPEVPCLHDL
jgi:hypothetical protein